MHREDREHLTIPNSNDRTGRPRVSGFLSFSLPDRGLLFFLACTAILYVHAITPEHDWGGDFAHYLQHTENIVTGRAYEETGYVRTDFMCHVGPASYPPGFPLLLAPVRALFGRELLPFKIAGGFFLLLSLAAIWQWSEGRLTKGSRFALLFLFGWNPIMLEGINHILSDIPFVLFTVLSLTLIRRTMDENRPGPIKGVLLTFLLLFTTGIRPVGPLLLAPLMIETLRRRRLTTIFPWAVACGVLAGAVGLRFLFPGLSHGDIFHGTTAATIRSNQEYYGRLIVDFCPVVPFLSASRWFVFFLSTFFGVAGVIRSLRNGHAGILTFLVLYTGLFLLFPFHQGHRYLYPVYPFLIYYFLFGFEWIGGLVRLTRRRAASAVLLLLVAVAGVNGIVQSGILHRERVDGPETPAARALFAYVKEKMPADAVYVFRRPRVFAYYTGHRSAALPIGVGLKRSVEYFSKNDIVFVVFDTMDRRTRELEKAISAEPSLFQAEYDDGRFLVYRCLL